MEAALSDLLKAEAEYAEAHKDAPLKEGTIITHRGQRSRVFSIRLSESEFTALEEASKRLGVPSSTLARQWISERLASDTEPTDLQGIANALAVFSKRLSAL